jgi:uncharacterized protein (DUF2147 family)
MWCAPERTTYYCGEIQMLKTIAAAAIALSVLAAPVLAQDQVASPEGTWVDAEGTSFTFSLCGDGTALCGVLNDIQGESRTEENLAFVNTEVVQAEQTAPGRWEGTINYGGRQAGARVTLVAENALEIRGCQLAILCESITFYKAS